MFVSVSAVLWYKSKFVRATASLSSLQDLDIDKLHGYIRILTIVANCSTEECGWF